MITQIQTQPGSNKVIMAILIIFGIMGGCFFLCTGGIVIIGLAGMPAATAEADAKAKLIAEAKAKKDASNASLDKFIKELETNPTPEQAETDRQMRAQDQLFMAWEVATTAIGRKLLTHPSKLNFERMGNINTEGDHVDLTDCVTRLGSGRYRVLGWFTYKDKRTYFSVIVDDNSLGQWTKKTMNAQTWTVVEGNIEQDKTKLEK